jgi:predicted glycosyltransferase
LHPNYFTPNPQVLEKLNLKPGEIYSIIRLVSWEAVHDIHQKGIPDKYELISFLNQFGKVFISSESELPPDLEDYRLPTKPHELHDVLYYTSLYIGEGATTASEAAVLGTYSIYVNSLFVSNVDDQEKRYGIAFQYNTPEISMEEIYEKITQILQDENLHQKKEMVRNRISKDMVDVTDFFIKYIEKESMLLNI